MRPVHTRKNQHARPLDAEAALERAAQIAAIADADRLMLLATIAASATGALTPAMAALRLNADEREITAMTDVLRHAGLVDIGDDRAASLTADAWMRFGGMLLAEHRLLAVGNEPVLPTPIQRTVKELEYRFSSTFSPETVRRYVAESYELLAARAKVRTFLPTLTARFATDRLAALATARGLSLHDTPEVLFICRENAGRSQMASAVLQHVAGDRVHVRTAGSAPASRVNAIVAGALDEIGLTVPTEFPKPLTDEVVQASDFIITMGCGDACPVYPGRRYMDWIIADPAGQPISRVRSVLDDIITRVGALVSELGIAAARPLPVAIR